MFISIKFATRFDSPGCLDLFDKEIVLNETHFDMSVFCRIDKKVMRYELSLEFFEPINITTSYHEFSSVGRLYLNLFKDPAPSRWRRLLKHTDKVQNM